MVHDDMNQAVDWTVNESVDPKGPEEHCSAVVFENETAQQTPDGCAFFSEKLYYDMSKTK